MSGSYRGHHGVEKWTQRPSYETYKSPYGPAYKTVAHFHGLNFRKVVTYGAIASGFGVSAGIFALFFFGDVPRVRKDILQKVPVIGPYFVREIPPEDNPF